MANHPVKLDMLPLPPPKATKRQGWNPPPVRLYLIRHEEKVFYFMARCAGFQNMRVAVSDVEAEQWVGADPLLPLEERARMFAQERVGIWVKQQMLQRPTL